jgi:hypothetical protein
VCYTHVGKRSTLERCDEATLVMSKKSDHSANCNTERYGIYRRGYCEFCYRLIVQKEEVERWDLKDPSTLKRVPGIASYSQRRFEEEFPKIKAARVSSRRVDHLACGAISENPRPTTLPASVLSAQNIRDCSAWPVSRLVAVEFYFSAAIAT